MNRTAQRQRVYRWLPRAGLLMVLAAAGYKAVGSGDAATLPCLPADVAAIGPPLAGEFEFLSWNIQKTSNAGWQEELSALTSGVHLAFLQEAISELEGAAGTQHRAFAPGYHDGERQTGVLTLSAGAHTRQCSFTITEPWLGTPKAATVTEYALAGRDEPLLAINLHAVNFTFGVEDLRRQLQPLADMVAEHRGPVIVAGDFNTWSASRQAAVDTALARFELVPLQFEQDRRSTAFGRPLDHIYVRGLQVQRAEVVEVGSSDHNALRARLVVE